MQLSLSVSLAAPPASARARPAAASGGTCFSRPPPIARRASLVARSRRKHSRSQRHGSEEEHAPATRDCLAEHERGEWESMFAELAAYEALHGDCNVPARWAEKRELRSWAEAQREARAQGRLEAWKERRMRDINFEWDAEQAEWEERLAEVAEHVAKVGGSEPPFAGRANVSFWKGNEVLGEWVMAQRMALQKGTLSATRAQALMSLGLGEDVGPVLGHRPGGLSAERVRKLEEIGMDAGDIEKVFAGGEVVDAPTWMARFSDPKERERIEEALRALDKNEAELKPGGRGSEDSGEFEEALHALEEATKGIEAAHAIEDRIEVLELEGGLDPEFKARYEELATVMQEEGGYENIWAENPRLGRWAVEQSHLYATGRLGPARAEKLDQLGLDWARISDGGDMWGGGGSGRAPRGLDVTYEFQTRVRADTTAEFGSWSEKCDALGAQLEGGGGDPLAWLALRSEYPALAVFAEEQHRLYSSGKLGEGRARRLEAIGVADWSFPRAPEKDVVRKGQKGEEGPRDYGGMRPAEWQARVMELEDKIRYLDEKVTEATSLLQKALDADAEEWEEWSSRLARYKLQHGDCNAPLGTEEGQRTALGEWIERQRRDYHHGILPQERAAALAAMGLDLSAGTALPAAPPPKDYDDDEE